MRVGVRFDLFVCEAAVSPAADHVRPTHFAGGSGSGSSDVPGCLEGVQLAFTANRIAAYCSTVAMLLFQFVSITVVGFLLAAVRTVLCC